MPKNIQGDQITNFTTIAFFKSTKNLLLLQFFNLLYKPSALLTFNPHIKDKISNVSVSVNDMNTNERTKTITDKERIDKQINENF